MKRSPNWNEEELMLALELYLSKGLPWLSTINDNTQEIIELSYILQNLDFYDDNVKPNAFRSVGSVRMKLSNFKAVDPHYEKNSLSNIGKTDLEVWKKYSSSIVTLREKCKIIIDEHFVGDREKIDEWLLRYVRNDESKENDFIILSDEVKGLIDKYRNACELEGREELVKACDILSILIKQSYQQDRANNHEHGGVNRERIGDKSGSSFSNTINNKETIVNEILKFIQDEDSKEIKVEVSKIKRQFPNYKRLDELLDALIQKGVLRQYQGSMRELVVDDYDLLYELIHKTTK